MTDERDDRVHPDENLSDVVEAAAASDIAGEAADPDARDAALDEGLDDLDDGSALVGSESLATPRADALPFDVSVQERFAELSDVEPTGEARVDAATARLSELPGLPTPDHVAVYDDVHRRLQDALSDADVR